MASSLQRERERERESCFWKGMVLQREFGSDRKFLEGEGIRKTAVANETTTIVARLESSSGENHEVPFHESCYAIAGTKITKRAYVARTKIRRDIALSSKDTQG